MTTNQSRWTAALLAMAFAVSCTAAEPSWWRARGVLNGSAADDFAAANAGQLKNVAVAAFRELDERLPHGAGPDVALLAGSFRNADNFAAITLSQLKAVAKPFYDRLIAEGVVTAYPWKAGAKADDTAAANLGQLKHVFSFEIRPSK